MVTVSLKGGLGNQMFQYATARALALKHQVPLALDTGFYSIQHDHDAVTPREFELNIFRLVEHVEVVNKVGLQAGTSFVGRLQRSINKRLQKLSTTRFVEPSLRFDERVLALPANVYLDGYFQCERYFANHRDALLEAFELNAPLHAEYVPWKQRIESCNAVAVHFRRKDYITSSQASKAHGALDFSYYIEAIRQMQQRFDDAEFFVFSDDIADVRNAFSTDARLHFVRTESGYDSARDTLECMRSCRHFIVANSSFSWWAAWLGTAADKQVVAPQRWFADPSRPSDDIVPESWIRL